MSTVGLLLTHIHMFTQACHGAQSALSGILGSMSAVYMQNPVDVGLLSISGLWPDWERRPLRSVGVEVARC